jgi:23S rRNA-/tRNA-specific pseudouridylate synthase
MSDTHTTLTIDTDGVRLAKRLSTQFPYSRSFFEHLFARGAIMLNGKKAKKSTKTIKGQKVEITSLDRFVDGGILDEAPAIDLPIHHETDDYLVLYKPKGVLSHPNSIRDVGQPSVV